MSGGSLLAGARIPTSGGTFSVIPFDAADGRTHVAITPLGWAVEDGEAILYAHRECVSGDVFGSINCDCRQRLDEDTSNVTASPSGVLIYLKARDGASSLHGHDVDAYADEDVGDVARVLRRLMVTRVLAGRMPKGLSTGLEMYDIEMSDRDATSMGERQP